MATPVLSAWFRLTPLILRKPNELHILKKLRQRGMSCSGSHLQEVLCFETPLHHFPSAMPRARQRRLVVGVWAQESGSLCIPVPPLTVPSCVSSINCYSVFLLLPLFYPIAPGHEPSSRSSGWVPTIQGHQLMPKRFSASCQQSEYWGSPCTRSGRFLIG